MVKIHMTKMKVFPRYPIEKEPLCIYCENILWIATGDTCILNSWWTCLLFNPSNAAQATYVRRTRKQRFVKTIKTLWCWYPLDSSHWVLSDGYPCAKVSAIFLFFFLSFVSAKLATTSIRVKTIHVLDSLFLIWCLNTKTQNAIFLICHCSMFHLWT